MSTDLLREDLHGRQWDSASRYLLCIAFDTRTELLAPSLVGVELCARLLRPLYKSLKTLHHPFVFAEETALVTCSSARLPIAVKLNIRNWGRIPHLGYVTVRGI